MAYLVIFPHYTGVLTKKFYTFYVRFTLEMLLILLNHQTHTHKHMQRIMWVFRLFLSKSHGF